MKKLFLRGIKDGIPIALGYLSVAFGFGILSVSMGLSVLQAVGISASNLTSAGQVAGVEIIAAGGTLIEIILTQLVINIRYSLMGISLSQKIDPSFGTLQRLIVSFGITDEIFAVSYAQKGKIKPVYMYGLIVIAFLGWTSGTLIGAAAGAVLPESVMNAMGILLYAMFLAIIIPAARDDKGALFTVAAAACLSVIFRFFVPALSGGFSVIISAIAAAALAALLFPVKEEE
ncbi:MAG: AzlC family ABC transporter permease [Clostridia bacterium]|nr:AzlC family ABC transporter permease [Clostridia bacterium]